MKSFEKWKYQELYKEFGLERVYEQDLLAKWLDCSHIILSEKETERSAELHQELVYEIDAWQEDELKSFFIIPIIEIVQFRRRKSYKSFTQRNIEAEVKNLKNEEMLINGRVEFLVARGEQDPETPFFFVHEYPSTWLRAGKPEIGAKSDPIGQLLAAMYVAQVKNEGEDPIYGLYIVGRNWFFVILIGKEYCISDAYDAVKYKELLEIVKILKQVKHYIDIRTNFMGN